MQMSEPEQLNSMRSEEPAGFVFLNADIFSYVWWYFCLFFGDFFPLGSELYFSRYISVLFHIPSLPVNFF